MAPVVNSKWFDSILMEYQAFFFVISVAISDDTADACQNVN